VREQSFKTPLLDLPDIFIHLLYASSRPENNVRPYTIGTTFPNRTLEDDSSTIEAAGLRNSVIVQRWV
jgi:hypothetical protein